MIGPLEIQTNWLSKRLLAAHQRAETEVESCLERELLLVVLDGFLVRSTIYGVALPSPELVHDYSIRMNVLRQRFSAINSIEAQKMVEIIDHLLKAKNFH
ncbi:MAG TPA: hypothetical protein VLE93_01200 [Candidatus Saccharimonadales bacterium]|nr:hypothetical protein [Candidatus Saccharimonadales bacterium]